MPHDEHLNFAFAVKRSTTSTTGVMPHLLPLVAGLPGSIFFYRTMIDHTEVSQDSLPLISTLPTLSPNSSPIELIWDSLGLQLGNKTTQDITRD
ncbi:hypothetical protein TNCV_4515891 [Trichonephila clavipes]|nr:hypothetical protein TNCV_4515891 [Trichonephila clavipes]